ncbi:hypothetical protein C8J57DRAFT_1245654 [Mycena rebaudengoi]|nr:hypothetical protein C8J57DRAFT_1245654 [Mycena rebaudengoi]
MHAILPAGLPVQELWDLIIDEILSKKDLQSCSLVCRAFVARAQFPLFCFIYIWRTTHQHTVVRAIELASLLATSPHIIPHIRRLTLGACDPDVLSPLVQIPWTHLESIRVGLRVSSAVDLHRIPNLVCLRSLREVVFRGGQWKTEDTAKILSHCTQYLARVEFFECGRAAAGVPLVSQCRTPKIRRLYFKDSAMPGTLIDYPLPWDLSALTHVRVSRSMHGLKSFMLQLARPAADDLNIDHGIESLDLSIFPALKYLTSDSMGRSFNTMLTSLPPNNTIDTICICIRWLGQIPQLVPEFQKTFISLKLPVLRRMEMEVAPEALYFHYNAAELRKRFQRDLSQIHERGLLSVHFVAANRTAAFVRDVLSAASLALHISQILDPPTWTSNPEDSDWFWFIPLGCRKPLDCVHAVAILHELVLLKHFPTKILASNVQPKLTLLGKSPEPGGQNMLSNCLYIYHWGPL